MSANRTATPRHPPRRRRGAVELWDLAFDLMALIIVVVEVWNLVHRDVDWRYVVVLVCALAATQLRRRMPATATVVAGALTLLPPTLGASVLTCAVLTQICLFSAVVRHSRERAVALAALTGVQLSAAVALSAADSGGYVSVAIVLPWTGLVLGAGFAVRSHRDYVRALEDSAAATQAARESEAERRVADERVRIARDLHDAVAHSFAVINVHAGAAERTLDTDPARAAVALAEVRRASRRVMHELRDIVSVLRAGDDDVTGVPASADGIGALLEEAATTGLAVTVDVSTDLGGLDPVADVALYRVLQESLTNARRHGTGSVTVTISGDPDAVTLVVSNPCRSVPDDRPGGFGLIGMHERVQRAGGRISASSDDQGMFQVRVRLPRPTPQQEGTAP
jgi:signal transduction histidine kinase